VPTKTRRNRHPATGRKPRLSPHRHIPKSTSTFRSPERPPFLLSSLCSPHRYIPKSQIGRECSESPIAHSIYRLPWCSPLISAVLFMVSRCEIITPFAFHSQIHNSHFASLFCFCGCEIAPCCRARRFALFSRTTPGPEEQEQHSEVARFNNRDGHHTPQ
jgi:hypothetical protein